MIVAIVAAAALAPSKDALIERWLRANHAHLVARLAPAPAPPISPPNLWGLAQREFAVKGQVPTRQICRGRGCRTLVVASFALDVQALAAVLGSPVCTRPRRAAGSREPRRCAARTRRHPDDFCRGALVKKSADRTLPIRVLGLRRCKNRRLRVLSTGRPAMRPAGAITAPRRSCSLLRWSRCSTGRVPWTLSASATVGDLRRELRAHNARLVAPFDAVAAPFVQEAYAERTVDEPQWHRARDAFATLLQEGAQP